MPDNNEPKDLVLARLDKVLTKLDAMHGDMLQIKARLSSLEKQHANTSEAVAAQWENFDNHAEQIRKLNDRVFELEHPAA